MNQLPATPRFIIRLPSDLRRELEELASAEGRSLSNLIVFALREWLASRRNKQQ